ncbi:hypothetical protein [uncultured Rhodoblastus sp.]|uniref:hypothetical protein n=1 Tax=uncultured Rhodoblastus sp. TaxID=543037 RepID=UPI0025E6149B|nr:hypothetical protein [uncultured Rhodoblastus sp.]
MKSVPLLPIAFCLALGACASIPPSGPSVVAVAGENVSDQKFARDDAECRARAHGGADRAAANGELGLQNLYDSVYAKCMSDRGYQIEGPPVPRYAWRPGPYFYGPGPYWGPGPFYGPGVAVYYGGGWGYGRRW